MKNKVLVDLIVPEIDEEYSVYLPINKKIGNIIILLNKAIYELTNGDFLPILYIIKILVNGIALIHYYLIPTLEMELD